MKLILLILIFSVSYLTGSAQLITFYYPSHGIYTSRKPLKILKSGDDYLFKTSRDTSIYIIGKHRDTVISEMTFGPYQFKLQGDRIKVKNLSSDSSFSDMYLLIKDTVFLIQELWSGTTDSRVYDCRYLGDSIILIEGRSYNCFTFFVDSNQDDSRYIEYKKVYLSKEFLIPMKIERYKDARLTIPTSATEVYIR